MKAEEKGTAKEKVEAMQKKFDVSICKSAYTAIASPMLIEYVCGIQRTVYEYVTKCVHDIYNLTCLQNFVTDLTATSVRVKDINIEAEQMVKGGHSLARKIQARRQQLNDKWVKIYEMF